MAMFWNKPKRNIRARDGWERLTSSERRTVRKLGGLSSRQQKKIIKERRRRKKGW